MSRRPLTFLARLRGATHSTLVWWLVAMMLSNALMPLTASAANTSTKVLLCTSTGYQWVTLDSTRNELNGDGSNSSQFTSNQSTGSKVKPVESDRHCVFCITSDDDYTKTLSDIDQLRFSPSPTSPIRLAETDFISTLLLTPVNPRAPPFIL